MFVTMFLIFGTLWCLGLVGISYLKTKYDFVYQNEDAVSFAYVAWGLMVSITLLLLCITK